MKLFASILIYYLVISHAFGQNMMSYYTCIKEGKKYVIQNDLPSAIQSYKKALLEFDVSFARDYYNAIEISIRASDTIHLSFFIKNAIIHGIRIEDILTISGIADYQKCTFYENLKSNEDSLTQIYKININWALRDEFNQMFYEDQLIREDFYNTNFFTRHKVKKAWEELNAKQVVRIIEITKRYGFPGEKLIGIDREEMHIKLNTKNFTAGIPIIILIHHFSQPNSSHHQLLLEEVKKGNLNNEHYATICDFQAEFGNKEFSDPEYYGLRHLPKEIDANRLNTRRAEIGIMSIDQIKSLNKISWISKFWNRLY